LGGNVLYQAHFLVPKKTYFKKKKKPQKVVSRINPLQRICDSSSSILSDEFHGNEPKYNRTQKSLKLFH